MKGDNYMDKSTVKELIDSFIKICDYIETTDGIGCIKCPIFNECFHKDKHKGLSELMDSLAIKRNA